MFLKFFGKDRDPATLSQRDWDRFIRDRRSGRVGPSGKPVSDRTGLEVPARGPQLAREVEGRAGSAPPRVEPAQRPEDAHGEEPDPGAAHRAGIRGPVGSVAGDGLALSCGFGHRAYAEAFDHLVDVGEDHDLSFILQNLGDRVDYRSGDESDTSHYAILQELASLPRTGLAAFKARLKLCVEAVRSGEFRNPTHFADPAGDCGFLITPWDTHLGIPQEAYLRTLTELSKYSFGAGRQVGACVSLESEALYILWCHIKRPHVVDTSLDAALAADDCPLPPTAARNIPTYDFDTEGLERLLSSDDE